MNTNMKVLRELGITVVAGDVIDGVATTPKTTEFYNESGNQGSFVSEFAWRGNDGKQPVGYFVVVEVIFDDNSTGSLPAGMYYWGVNEHGKDVTQWRPCLESLSEIETTAKPKPDEPDFTASVPEVVFTLGHPIEKPKVIVELSPVIGGEYEYSWTSDFWYRCIIVDIGQVGYMIRSNNYARPQFHEKESVQFRPIKSERDIAIDEMCKVDILNATRDMMGDLYDLGYRK